MAIKHLSKAEFMDHFAVAFVATEVANGYQEACSSGKPDCRHLMCFEDAETLAEIAWEEQAKL